MQRVLIGLAKDVAPRSQGRLEGDIEVWDLVQPDKASLGRLKRVSIRNKSWFSVLSSEQRRFMDAIIVTLDRIRSLVLLRLVVPLIRRLLTVVGGDARNGALALMDEGAHRMMKIAAERIAAVARQWGNKSACEWPEDAGFTRYLIAISLPVNKNPPMFSILKPQGKI